MRIDQAILGLYHNKKIEKIYYKNYKIFDYDENKVNKPCYLEFPLNLEKNEMIAQVFPATYINGVLAGFVGLLNKLEFIYYEDFNARFEEYHKEEYVIDLLRFKNSKNTIEDYFLNDEKTVYFQLTYQKNYGYNVYIIGLTKNMIIKNNHLDLRRASTDSRGINGRFKYIKFNDLLHLENPNEPVDLSYCFSGNRNLKEIEDFEKIGITKVSNLENFCSNCVSLESGLSLFFQNLTTSYVKSLKDAFAGCNDLTDTILLQNIHLSNDCDSDALDSTFYYCENINLSSSQIRHFDFTKLTQLNDTFYKCRFTESDNIVDFSNLNFSNIVSLKYFLNPYNTDNYIDFSNSLFPDVEDLSSSFINLGKQNNFLNVSFPKAKNMSYTFQNTAPMNLDLDTSIFNNSNIENLRACFHASDLTDHDMSTILRKVLDLPSSVYKYQMFSGTKIDNLNFNNTTFEYGAILRYTTYSCPEYSNLFGDELLKNATINTIDMNNCIFKEPIITVVAGDGYVEDPESKIPYFNYLDILFYGTFIKTLNMNNCTFGKHMIPSFWCSIENINLNNPQPYSLGQKLLCDRYPTNSSYITDIMFQSEMVQMEQWIEGIFNDGTYLSSISFRNFVFPNENLFGSIHIAKGTNVIKYTGLFNRSLKRIDLSGSNIRSIYLERLVGHTDDQIGYYETFDTCKLTELILNHLPEEFDLFGGGVRVCSSKIDLRNNTFNYSTFRRLMDGSYDTLQDLNISDVTLNVESSNFYVSWLCENIDDTNLIINFEHPIKTLRIECCKLNHLNLNTVLDGRILNNIDVLESLDIWLSKMTEITLLSTDKMNFDEGGRLDLSLNEDLEEIHFIDNNSFVCTELGLTECKSLTTNALHSIFQHMDCRGDRSTLTFQLSGCTSLTTCDFSNLKYIPSNPVMESSFKSDSNLITVNFNNIKIHQDSGSCMFQYCSSLRDILNIDFDGYVSGAYMFDGCSSLTTVPAIPASGSTYSKSAFFDYIPYMFNGCSSLTSIDVSRFNLSHIKNIEGMFQGCSSLTSVDASNWNTPALENISDMFSGCSSLTSINISNWDTTNLRGTQRMFSECSSLTNIQLFSFPTIDTTKQYDFSGMFRECSNLINISLKNFHCHVLGNHGYGYGTKISYMFDGCTKLETIYTDNNDDNIIDIDYITEREWNPITHVFNNCVNLVGGMGTSYIDTQTENDGIFAQADKGSEKQGYFTYQSIN